MLAQLPSIEFDANSGRHSEMNGLTEWGHGHTMTVYESSETMKLFNSLNQQQPGTARELRISSMTAKFRRSITIRRLTEFSKVFQIYSALHFRSQDHVKNSTYEENCSRTQDSGFGVSNSIRYRAVNLWGPPNVRPIRRSISRAVPG